MGGRAVVARPLAQVPTLSAEDVTTPSPPVTPTSVAENHAALATGLLTYTIQPGDTLLTVALEIGVDLDDMSCLIAPDFTPDQPLVIGNVLALPTQGLLCHAVQPGESLGMVAAQYGVAAQQIYQERWNRLQDRPLAAVQLRAGAHLRIPIAPGPTQPVNDAPTVPLDAENFLTRMLQQPVNSSPFVALAVGGANRARVVKRGAVPANWPYGSGHFTWPLFGWLTQGYRYDHRAVDIAAPLGTLVTASDRGVVIRAGWNEQGYGNFVVIDHNIDYITLYAHLDEIFVQEGQVVAQGQPLGRVGSTGNSTGPHLHFEVRDFGRLTNPLELLGR
jgi:murein DD-endopeptidase MepM/ murein hydrolase activator NlpD